jgi:two-component system, NarL family, nitrate/nitrite response regulator NarL
MIRVLVIGNEVERCDRLGRLLSASGCLEVTTAPAAAQERCWHTTAIPQLVVCELDKSADGAFFNQLRQISARCPTLVTSDIGSPVDAASAVQAGASGYLTWNGDDGATVAAVISASGAGGHPASSRLANLLYQVVSRFQGAQQLLSRREREVLGYIARGYTHRQIATRIGVSKATVDTYVNRIRSKLGVGNKAELALLALVLEGEQ